MESKQVMQGTAIVVLDRGFVYVGEVTVDGDWCNIENAKNLRYWGTTEGLGELARNGPTEKTKIDSVGTVRAPMRAVISLIDTEPAKWNVS
jgi:hypothetical protein